MMEDVIGWGIILGVGLLGYALGSARGRVQALRKEVDALRDYDHALNDKVDALWGKLNAQAGQRHEPRHQP